MSEVDARAGRSAHWETGWQLGIPRGALFDNDAPSKALVDWLSRTKRGTAAVAAAAAEGEGEGEARPTALVPGCGRGYDVLALASCGFEATGLDLAPTAVLSAAEFFETVAGTDSPLVPGLGHAHVVPGDFFEHTPAAAAAYDVVFDVTFLCAIHPDARPKWAAKMKELTVPGGELATLIFPIGKKAPGGPPFDMSVRLVEGLLLPLGFEMVELTNPLPAELHHLDGKVPAASAFAVWRRSADAGC